jgi:hypothetical protein
MRVVPYSYVPGGAYGICDRCGFKFRLTELKKEWDGLLVCSQDWDPLPDTMTPPVVYPEGLPEPDSRPEAPDTFVGTVTPEDL